MSDDEVVASYVYTPRNLFSSRTADYVSQIDNMQRQLAAADEGQESIRLNNTRYSVLCAEMIVTINKRKMNVPEYDHISKICLALCTIY